MAVQKTYIAFAFGLSILVCGCRTVEGSNSSYFGDTCQEDTDPPSYGCVDVQGTVKGSRGQPLYNIDVSPVASTLGGLAADFALTDLEGHYELRLLETANTTGPVRFSLKATYRTNTGDEVSSQIILVTVPIADVGERPDPVTINFTLPVN